MNFYQEPGVITLTNGSRGYGTNGNSTSHNGRQHQKLRQRQRQRQRQQQRQQQRKQQHPPVKQLGLTSAICLAEPSSEDVKRTAELNRALESSNVFETKAELNQRVQILANLNMLYKQWIKDVAIAKNVPKAVAEKLGGKICAFGSYRLGVHSKGADIDALCVAPVLIERTEYFTTFFELLKQQAEVTECHAVELAFVPIIKLKYNSIEIDLLFASLCVKVIPDDFDLSDNNLLRNLDPLSVRSLNGCRVTDEILALVPKVETFRLTLQAIKLWAKRHGIYSNSLGYFGGVTWAMLVARTCQLYPNAAAATLVHNFFKIFTIWQWPLPVLLRKPDNMDLALRVWDPRVNNADRYHLMPVITPAYPQQNSTFNVSESTRKIIVNELRRGLTTMNEIMLRGAKWDRFFEAPSFFYRYQHFLVLLVTSQTADDQLAWCGLVESKIRLLVVNLEQDRHISLAHVNTKCFEYKKASANTQTNPAPFCSMWFIGLNLEGAMHLNVDLTKPIGNFTEQVTKRAASIKMLKDGMNIETRYVNRKCLSQYLGKDYLKYERKSMEQQMAVNGKRSSSELSTEEEEVKRKGGGGRKLRLSE